MFFGDMINGETWNHRHHANKQTENFHPPDVCREGRRRLPYLSIKQKLEEKNAKRAIAC